MIIAQCPDHIALYDNKYSSQQNRRLVVIYSPGRRTPDAIHSNKRRRASPGLRGAGAELTHFSTSSSMACRQKH